MPFVFSRKDSSLIIDLIITKDAQGVHVITSAPETERNSLPKMER